MQRMEIQHLVVGQKMTPGYRHTGATRARAAATKIAAAAPLLPYFDAAIHAQEDAAMLAQSWEVQEQARDNLPEAADLHRVLSTCLGGLYDTLVLNTQVYGPAKKRAADKVLKATVPDGIQYITSAPYREAVLTVQAIVTKLGTRDFAPAVRTLALNELVERLEVAASDLADALSREDAERVLWDDVTAADDAGAAAMGELVARILGEFPTNDPEDIEARKDLLGPIFAEEQKMRALRRSRKLAAKRSDDDTEDDAADPTEATDAKAAAGATGDAPADAAAGAQNPSSAA